MDYGFVVHGVPAPQGSKRAFVVNGRAVLTEASAKVKPWREDVKLAALAERGSRPPMLGPVKVSVHFFLVQPKSVKRALPHVKPDLDKLTRSTLDALTSAGVFRDDSQVVDLRVSKRYSDEPGASIYVCEVE